MKRTTLIAATVALAVGSTAVIATAHDRGGAEAPRGPIHGEMLFERFDLNEDGELTRNEVAGAAAAHFAETDANGDGKLTAEELLAAHETRMAERRARRVDQMIERLDTDSDGMLTLEEMTRVPAENRLERMFEHLDADEDGVITTAEAEEMRGRRGPGRGHRRHGHGHN